jgi:hypothetical protein
MSTPTTFRLDAEELAELDELAELLTSSTSQIIGHASYPWNRTMALRYAVKSALDLQRDARAVPEAAG